jgi:hypothetical protein
MKKLTLTNILPIALGFALGYVAYKMVAKMIGDQDEVEPMLSATGRLDRLKIGDTKIKYKCCCSDGSSHKIRGNMSCPCGVSGNNAYEIPCKNYNIAPSF